MQIEYSPQFALPGSPGRSPAVSGKGTREVVTPLHLVYADSVCSVIHGSEKTEHFGNVCFCQIRTTLRIVFLLFHWVQNTILKSKQTCPFYSRKLRLQFLHPSSRGFQRTAGIQPIPITPASFLPYLLIVIAIS